MLTVYDFFPLLYLLSWVDDPLWYLLRPLLSPYGDSNRLKTDYMVMSSLHNQSREPVLMFDERNLTFMSHINWHLIYTTLIILQRGVSVQTSTSLLPHVRNISSCTTAQLPRHPRRTARSCLQRVCDIPDPRTENVWLIDKGAIYLLLNSEDCITLTYQVSHCSKRTFIFRGLLFISRIEIHFYTQIGLQSSVIGIKNFVVKYYCILILDTEM